MKHCTKTRQIKKNEIKYNRKKRGRKQNDI